MRRMTVGDEWALQGNESSTEVEARARQILSQILAVPISLPALKSGVSLLADTTGVVLPGQATRKKRARIRWFNTNITRIAPVLARLRLEFSQQEGVTEQSSSDSG